MTEQSVNGWLHLEVSGVTYKVKALGLLEISSMSLTFFQKRQRIDLREEADDFFKGEPVARIDFINEQRKLWPKGEELTGLSIAYAETGECQDQFCIYALNRFNKKQLSTLEKAEEIYNDMNIEDQIDMFKHIFGGMGDIVENSIEESLKLEGAENEETPGKTDEPAKVD